MIRKRFEKKFEKVYRPFFCCWGEGLRREWGKRGLGKGEGEREKLIFKKFWGEGKRDFDLERENVKGES